MPTVEFPVAAPRYDAQVAAVPDETEQLIYVYLSRVVDGPHGEAIYPKANIPTVEFPAAEPA